jgi:hypothetical protein
MVVLLILPLLLTLLEAPLIAQEEFSIRSNKVDYHENELFLDGDVCITTHEKGELSGQQAHINFESLKGELFGSHDCPCVTYKNDHCHPTKPSEKSALSIKSLSMVITLKKPEKELVLNGIEAKGEVKAIYNDDYEVICESSVYDPSSGKLYLYSSPDKMTLNQIKHLDDLIFSEALEIDTQKRELTFSKAHGTLKKTSQFSADEIIWNDKTQRLDLKKNVELKVQGIGDLATSRSLFIELKQVDGKREVKSIEGEGELLLNYVDNQKGFIHYLNSPGPLKIDHEKFQMFMEGATSTKEGLSNYQQIHISNMMGDLYADQAILTYQFEENSYTPLTLHMEGNVKLINRFNGHEQETGLELQNILADSMDLFLQKREVYLKATPPHQVLIYDRVKNMQMSGPAFIMTYDENFKPTLRGVGQTRLKFAEKELQQMKTIFQLKDLL